MNGLKDLSSSIWMWHREGSEGRESWRIHRATEIREDPERAADLARLRRIQKRTSSFRFLLIRPTLHLEHTESSGNERSV